MLPDVAAYLRVRQFCRSAPPLTNRSMSYIFKSRYSISRYMEVDKVTHPIGEGVRMPLKLFVVLSKAYKAVMDPILKNTGNEGQAIEWPKLQRGVG